MIELVIILGLAVLGWLAWKGKLKSIGKIIADKFATPTQQATSGSVKTTSQADEPSPVAPAIQQPVAVEPIVEPAPQASILAAVVVEEPKTPLTLETPAIKQPEDSILKRHYLAGLQAEKDAISNPYPTDSVLRRHYETLHKIEMPQPAKTPEESSPIQPQVAAEETNIAETVVSDDTLKPKQDLDQLRSEIAAELPATPSDSVLKRHHENLLQAKLQQRLSEQ
jgi:hypothetical protein